ncbi:MAG: CHAD domain-containing protein [Acetobacteraceae bacterium]|nr:CHAD domain-containing protein [Acetobacteraceae bacterium]
MLARPLCTSRNIGARKWPNTPRIDDCGADPAPVDRTRVALGRLRAALMVFRAATETPVMLELAGDLHAFGHVLGLVWVWDVFLDETWARIAQAFSGEKAIQAALPAALCGRERYRAGAHRCRGRRVTRHPCCEREGCVPRRAAIVCSMPRKPTWAMSPGLGGGRRSTRRPMRMGAPPPA